MAEAVTLQTAGQALDAKLAKQAINVNNARTFAIMANDARSRGEHDLAKKHLRKALDFEFEAFASSPAIGPLAEQWYPGEEI